jgi:hypothetical protein
LDAGTAALTFSNRKNSQQPSMKAIDLLFTHTKRRRLSVGKHDSISLPTKS